MHQTQILRVRYIKLNIYISNVGVEAILDSG